MHGRRADLLQARRPEPHRRPQDQQRDRPGAAGAPHGQAAHHRRNRRRPARRGHRHHLRALRPRMRGLHGQRGRQAPGPERVPHEAAGRDRGAGRIGLEDAQGRAQRSDARLGHQHRKHLLHHRHRGRPAPVPDDGARLPVGDRRGVPGADARDDRAPAGLRDRLHRRRLERDGHLLSLHRREGRAAGRRGSGRRGHRHRASMRPR